MLRLAIRCSDQLAIGQAKSNIKEIVSPDLDLPGIGMNEPELGLVMVEINPNPAAIQICIAVLLEVTYDSHATNRRMGGLGERTPHPLANSYWSPGSQIGPLV